MVAFITLIPGMITLFVSRIVLAERSTQFENSITGCCRLDIQQRRLPVKPNHVNKIFMAENCSRLNTLAETYEVSLTDSLRISNVTLNSYSPTDLVTLLHNKMSFDVATNGTYQGELVLNISYSRPCINVVLEECDECETEGGFYNETSSFTEIQTDEFSIDLYDPRSPRQYFFYVIGISILAIAAVITFILYKSSHRTTYVMMGYPEVPVHGNKSEESDDNDLSSEEDK